MSEMKENSEDGVVVKWRCGVSVIFHLFYGCCCC